MTSSTFNYKGLKCLHVTNQNSIYKDMLTVTIPFSNRLHSLPLTDLKTRYKPFKNEWLYPKDYTLTYRLNTMGDLFLDYEIHEILDEILQYNTR